jgi:hypothetical protein
MQLFGLLNSLLRHHPATSRNNLHITRYNVMPLSANSGIIGWVKNCDTIHQVCLSLPLVPLFSFSLSTSSCPFLLPLPLPMTHGLLFLLSILSFSSLTPSLYSQL